MIAAAEFASAAERLAGVRWRKHGRDPLSGLDCAGLPAAAAAAVGLQLQDTLDYDAGMPDPDLVRSFCARNGDPFGWDEMGEGRIGLCRWRSSEGARHLVVMLSGRRIAHVDAMVRRVVVVPAGWLDGRLVATFRLHGLEYGKPW